LDRSGHRLRRYFFGTEETNKEPPLGQSVSGTRSISELPDLSQNFQVYLRTSRSISELPDLSQNFQIYLRTYRSISELPEYEGGCLLAVVLEDSK
jgi:hypothetical protein